MAKKARSKEETPGRDQGATGEALDKELQPLLWQAHVNEEMDELSRKHEPAPPLSHFAEEYAERAIRSVEASENELQQAARRGEPLAEGSVRGELADAGDIAGG